MSDWEPLVDRGEDEFGQRFDREEQATPEEFEGCACVAETAKALRVRWADGSFRWIPRTQIHSSSDIMKKGDEGTLVISAWLAGKLEEEAAGPEDDVFEVPNAVCLSEARSGKAILVRFGDDREEWIPRSQIVAGSEVTGDGDSGTLKVTLWLATEKKLT